MEEYKFGFTSCYIKDHPFVHVVEIPENVAKEWIALFILDMETWVNKQFVIVGGDHGKYIAISESDGKYHLYVQS